MLKVIKHECKRFYQVFLIVMAIYLIYSLININNHSELIYRLDARLILLLSLGVSLYPTICFIKDDFSINKLLYMKSDIRSTKIIMGKFLVVLIFASLALIIGTTFFNMKVLLYKQNHYLEYLRMNLDYIGLLFVDKSIKEWFYPINFLMNLFYDTIIIVAFFTYYRSQIQYENKIKTFLNAIIVILIPNTLIFYFINFLNEKINVLDFNYLSKRVEAMSLSNGEINFLSITSLIIYSLITVQLILFISRKKSEERL